MMARYAALALAFVLSSMAAAPLSAQNSGSVEIFDMFAPKERRSVTPDWTKINAAALGTRDNPVRCNMPDGERAYLIRLVCSDGTRPSFRRVGSLGRGPYTAILDGYEVTCGAGSFEVIMDMYHPGYVERRTVPGFSIRPPG